MANNSIVFSETGQQVCGARLVTLENEPQRFCGETDLAPNSRCRIHGGATPRGEKYWAARTGRWTPYLKGDDQRKYLELQRDHGSDKHSLDDEIDLIDSFIATATQNIEQGGSAKVLIEIAEAFDAFQDANAIGDEMTSRRALQRLERAIENGRKDGEARKEIVDLVDLRSKLAAVETKRLKDTGKFIELKKVVLIMTQLAGVIAKVQDVELRRSIITEFRSIVSRNAGGTALVPNGQAE